MNHEEYQIACPRCDAYDELDDTASMEQEAGRTLSHFMICRKCGFAFVEYLEFKYWRVADQEEIKYNSTVQNEIIGTSYERDNQGYTTIGFKLKKEIEE